MTSTPYSPRGCRRSGGFGLLQVMLLIAVLAGLSAMGYLQWRARTAMDLSTQEQQALAQADQAIVTFATVMHRLPCPATERGGLENCATPGVQKGWLPSASLRLAGADPGRHVDQMRYLVQRQGGEGDLTESQDAWRPLEYDEDDESFFAMRSGGYPTDIKTLTDLCQRLQTGREGAATAPLASINSSPVRATAYAVAHPGRDDADGDGDLFDGANALSVTLANLMEDPARRPLLSRYNDMVLERSHASLLTQFQCDSLINSINVSALGQDVASDVEDMRDDNIESARMAVAFNVLSATMTTLETALAITEGASDGVNATLEWIGCGLSLGLAVNLCAAAPVHTTASILFAGVVGANAVAIGLTAKAAITAGMALLLADSSAGPEQVCPPKDPKLNQLLLDAVKAEVDSAKAGLDELDAEIQKHMKELETAKIARTQSINALYSAIHGPGTSSDIDAYVESLLAAVQGWSQASHNHEVAIVKVTQAQAQVDRLKGEVNKYNAMLADIPGTITRLKQEIAALDAQIATNPPNKKDLEDIRMGKDAELQLAQGDAKPGESPPGLVAVRDLSQEDLVVAQRVLSDAIGVRDAAAPAFDSAKNQYQAAYAALVGGAKRYSIYNNVGVVIAHGCTTNCLPGDKPIHHAGAMTAILSELFGASASVEPSVDAKFLKPIKIQIALDALLDARDDALKRVKDAQERREEIQDQIANPAPCNVVGDPVVPMAADQAQSILEDVDRKGGIR